MTVEEVSKISNLVDRINHLENIKKILDSKKNFYLSVNNESGDYSEVVASFETNGDGYNQDLMKEICRCIDKYLSDLKIRLDSLGMIDSYKTNN